MPSSRRSRSLWLIVLLAVTMLGVEATNRPWSTLQLVSVALMVVAGVGATIELMAEERRRRRGDPLSRLDE